MIIQEYNIIHAKMRADDIEKTGIVGLMTSSCLIHLEKGWQTLILMSHDSNWTT